MKQQDFRCKISANVTAEEAIESINDVSAWWAKRVEGYSQSLHDIFTVRFGETFVTFEITELIPNKKVVWFVTDCYLHWINDKMEWKGTSIIWELTEKGDITEIDMTHVGLTPEVECFNDCKVGWTHHIKDSLAKFLTEQVGMPE
jgi:hypothetical protein